jgi:hypothetical protein
MMVQSEGMVGEDYGVETQQSRVEGQFLVCSEKPLRERERERVP